MRKETSYKPAIHTGSILENSNEKIRRTTRYDRHPFKFNLNKKSANKNEKE